MFVVLTSVDVTFSIR